jgi:hypothetical protein
MAAQGPGRVRLLFHLIVDPLRGQLARGERLLLLNLVGHVLNQVAMWARWERAGLSGSDVPYDASRLDLLARAAARAPPTGLWLEFGVFRGESINCLARLSSGTVYGFDSFEGLPARWFRLYPQGAFSTEGAAPPVEPNVELIKGLFSETLPAFLELRGEFSVALAHIDCDLYESARFVLFALLPGIRGRTVLIFDEFTGLLADDEARAFREFVTASDARFRYLGCSSSGSVAIEILS